MGPAWGTGAILGGFFIGAAVSSAARLAAWAFAHTPRLSPVEAAPPTPRAGSPDDASATPRRRMRQSCTGGKLWWLVHIQSVPALPVCAR